VELPLAVFDDAHDLLVGALMADLEVAHDARLHGGHIERAPGLRAKDETHLQVRENVGPGAANAILGLVEAIVAVAHREAACGALDGAADFVAPDLDESRDLVTGIVTRGLRLVPRGSSHMHHVELGCLRLLSRHLSRRLALVLGVNDIGHSRRH
jgi:hypothetical protein